jgi:hypothetical protein
MSFSLLIQNGDLALNGTALGKVEGGQKLVQDLSCAVLTPIGSYEEHPDFGSALDGGVTSNGYKESVIGESDWHKAATVVRSEIQRICTNYQRQQMARNVADGETYGKSTLTPPEILLSVQNIEVVEAQDNLLAAVRIATGIETIQANIPISGTSEE